MRSSSATNLLPDLFESVAVLTFDLEDSKLYYFWEVTTSLINYYNIQNSTGTYLLCNLTFDIRRIKPDSCYHWLYVVFYIWKLFAWTLSAVNRQLQYSIVIKIIVLLELCLVYHSPAWLAGDLTGAQEELPSMKTEQNTRCQVTRPCDLISVSLPTILNINMHTW